MGNEMELKPCPFCGSSRVKFYRVTGMYEAACSDCRCTSGIEGTKEAAAAAWNTRVSGWIPCSERMPEDYITVLLYGKIIGLVKGFFTSYKDFYIADSGRTAIRKSAVTHWMPLPEPPKGEKQ